jgi:DNA-directed RNA polymerase subunit N (RpoN/RPB10)
MKQKQMFSDGEELATSLARIFDRNLKMTDWPDVDCELKQCHVADNYKEKMEVLQNVIRSSASTVCSEHALDPLRACIARVVPEVEQLKSEREVKLTDYDSYRRRLKEKETKKEQLDVSFVSVSCRRVRVSLLHICSAELRSVRNRAAVNACLTALVAVDCV